MLVWMSCAYILLFVFRGSSFPSADQQVPFNGHFGNGGTSLAPDGMRSIHIKAHSEVTAAHETLAKL